MSSLQTLIAQTKAALVAAAPRIVETQAAALLALVVARIQTQGLGVAYSTRGVPVFFFYNRARNAAGRAYIAAKQKQKKPADRLGTWEEFKQAQGYGSSSVNLTYSGGMLRSLVAQAGGSSGTVYYAQLAASDAQSARLVGYNMQRYGDFLAPNAAEAAEVAAVGQIEINKVLQQTFAQPA